MAQAAPTAASAIDVSTRFLVELETLWTALRLYGTEHPAFRRGAETAAASLSRQVRVSVSPRGFTVGTTPVNEPGLLVLCQRLRAMALVGVVAEPVMTAAHVTALVLALDEADRSHAAGTAVVEKLAAVTARKVTAIPLRLASLHLTEGTSDDDEAREEQGAVWRDLFAEACSGGPGGADAGDLAAAFEAALRSVASPAQWDAMVGVWIRQLAAAAESPEPGEPGTGGGVTFGPGRARSSGAGAGTGAGSPSVPNGETLDAAAAFLGALSPHLSRRLLAETFGRQIAPHNVVMALAERLPKAVVLGALASVDRSSGQPSAAALALLRKMASNLPGAGDSADAAPRTTAEMAEIAASLEKLLGADQEAAFVPEGYLKQRQELSAAAVAAASAPAVAYPGERDTARHAATLAFQILSTPDTPSADLASALGYLRNRTGEWLKAGEFATASEGLSLAQGLCGHWDKAVAKPAADLVAHAVLVEDLVEGARRTKDPKERPATALSISHVLSGLDGACLARALATLKPSPAGGHEAVLEAFRKVMPTLGDGAVRGLCQSIKDATPPALLAVLSSLGAADAVKTVAAIAPHAAASTRRAVVHVIFRHDFRWPLALTDQLLKDDDGEIRRLAMMKLVSDTDLATAARIFQAAIDRHGPYEADVALGLAELLHRHRHHPDVRAAFRQWTWSGRRWAALLSFSLADRRSAA